jgi:shikimate kinase
MSVLFDELHHVRDHLYEKIATVTINTDDSNLDGHVNIVNEQFIKNGNTNKLMLNKEDLIVFHKTLHAPIDLTKQQARCLKLLAQGMSSKEIAKEMNLSFRTVEGLILKMIEKLGCSSSKELISLYLDKP